MKSFGFSIVAIACLGLSLAQGQTDGPSFAWDESKVSPDKVPLLRIKFPNNVPEDVAILKHYNPIQIKDDDSGPVDNCIFEGHLRHEPKVYVTITNGCPPSNNFEIQFKSKKNVQPMFLVKDGVGIAVRTNKNGTEDKKQISVKRIKTMDNEIKYVISENNGKGQSKKVHGNEAPNLHEEGQCMENKNVETSNPTGWVNIENPDTDLQELKSQLRQESLDFNYSQEQLEWLENQAYLESNFGDLEEIPADGFSINIKLWYDQLFKDQFQDDSVNVLRRVIAHAQHIFRYPSLTTVVKLNIVDVAEVKTSFTGGVQLSTLSSLTSYPEDTSINFNLFFTHENSKEGLFGIAWIGSSCTTVLPFRVGIARMTNDSLTSSRIVANLVANSLGIKSDHYDKDLSRGDSHHKSCFGGIMDFEANDNFEWSTCSVEDLRKFYSANSIFSDKEGLCSDEAFMEKIALGGSLVMPTEDGFVTLIGRHRCQATKDSKFNHISVKEYQDLIVKLNRCPTEDD